MIDFAEIFASLSKKELEKFNNMDKTKKASAIASGLEAGSDFLAKELYKEFKSKLFEQDNYYRCQRTEFEARLYAEWLTPLCMLEFFIMIIAEMAEYSQKIRLEISGRKEKLLYILDHQHARAIRAPVRVYIKIRL